VSGWAPLAEKARIVAGGNRLGRRLVRRAFGIGVAIGLVVMLLQVLYVYVTELQIARDRLDQIERTQVPQLATSVWLVNPAESGLVLDGLATLPGIAHVALRGDDGEVQVRGVRPTTVLAERRFPLQPRIAGTYRVGELEVVVGPTELINKLVRRSVFAGLTTLAAVGACVAALLVMFRLEVTRHLQRMAHHARDVGLEALDEPLHFDNKTEASPPDELDQLAQAFNGMRERIAGDVKRMRRYEAELSAHRDHLEGLVQIRTMELEEKARELEAQRAAIERLANTDALTGTLSRRHFHELGERELARAARGEQPIAALVLDIDHFKRVNDAHGHAGGDAVLKAFARRCQAMLRGTDVLGRLGGEEFAVLMPGSGLAEALVAAERIRAAVADVAVDVDGTRLAITVSIGAAARPAAETTLEVLLVAADEALYAAKRGGRNRVVAADAA
jgi:diguanylate cyclase (GGDEF)-like protein